MPTFLFSLSDSKSPDKDAGRVELASSDEARRQAIEALSEMAHDALPDGNHHEFTAAVSDQQGKPVFEASLVLRAKWLDGRH